MKQPVPQLGDETLSFENVNSFYSFWYGTDTDIVHNEMDLCLLVFHVHQSRLVVKSMALLLFEHNKRLL